MLQILFDVTNVVMLLFVPGFSLSYAIYPRSKMQAIHRFALSFIISAALVPGAVFILGHFAGTPFSIQTTFALVMSISVTGVYVYLCRIGVIEGLDEKVSRKKSRR